jgi:molybdate transport system substrate-binding protein
MFPVRARNCDIWAEPRQEHVLPSFTRRLFLATAASSMAAPAMAQGQGPVIAAASDLQFVLPVIAAAFTAETGHALRLSFGSTGNFARQIRGGAPFGLFMAADEDFITALHADGLTRDAGRLYGIGRLSLMIPAGGDLPLDPRLAGLAERLATGQLGRFAIANPDHAPYGMRAREALQATGLWDSIRPHLVLGENVSQAAQFALSGNAAGGIVSYALVLAPEIGARAEHVLVDEDLHSPLRQSMALLPGADAVAEGFYAYLQSPPARDVFAAYGFALPDDA